jgi:TonB-linked SusC/RagA family outer membrane protein
MKNELKFGEFKTSKVTKLSSVFKMTVLCLILSHVFVLNSYSANEQRIIQEQESEMSDALSAQNKTITGKVVEDNGSGLPGVSVVVKGSTVGTITDADGKYSINVPATGKELVFTFIGMTTQTVAIGSQSQINVTLESDVVSLNEVVAIGYGSMERNNVTGAISSVKTEEIMKAAVPNVVEALRGQVSGVKISRGSGQPGSGVGITIRGKRSLGSDDDGINENEPLMVIDGVPFTGGNMSEINPADIQSINILKDAAAASIYGASASNGVILITTKNGSSGKAAISVDASFGLTNLAMKPKLFDGEGYYQLKKNALIGYGKSITGDTVDFVLGDVVENANYKAGKEIDWHDELMRQGTVQNASLSVTGGTDKFHYYMNGDAYLEKGIVYHSDYNRYSFRMNADYTPYSFLTIGARVQLSKSFADETGLTLYGNDADFGDFVGNTPLGITHNEEGVLVPCVKGDQFQYNPLYRYANSQVDRTNTRVYINPWFEVKIVDGLTYHMNAFAEQRSENYSSFYSSIYSNSTLGSEPGKNKMNVKLNETTTYLFDNILNYRKIFNDVHSVDATLVYGIQTYDAYTLNTTGEGSSTDLLGYYDISGVPSSQSTVSLSPDQWAKEYYVGRVGYSFGERYNLTATIRRDGSSKFGPGKRYGYFPSIAGAWNIQNESFMADIPEISMLKFRASYGIMGNDNIPNFKYLATTSNSSYSFNNTTITGKTTDPATAPNPDLKWEVSNQFNTGIDFSLLKNRISGSVDYYITRTTDLLLTEQVPSSTGYTSVMSNIGKTKNWGIDANINFAILTGDFKWDMAVNWAKDHNEIVSLSRYNVDADGNPLDDEANGWFIGQDIDVIYDYKFDGIWQLGEEAQAAAMHPTIKKYGPGDAKIVDVSGDGVIDTKDKTFIGSPTPSWYSGIRNTFEYKGFELTVLLEAVVGVEKINNYYGNLTGRDNQIKVNYWTPTNPSNEFPEPNSSKAYDFANAVNFRDASFVSLRNVSLGYTLPQKLVKKTPFKALSLFVRGNNLMYFTEFKDSYSPEIDPWNFPITKTWTFSAKITF